VTAAAGANEAEPNEAEPAPQRPTEPALADTTETEPADPRGSELTPPDEVPGAAPPDEPSRAVLSEDAEKRLEQAERLLRGDAKSAVKALELLRALGETYATDARVLDAWTRAAARCKWWGESLQVALKWAALDQGPEAQLHLARTQRLVGQRYGAIQTLERLLATEPEHERALAMLVRYRDR
jgi:thioredoxin-like negative regulator of GroEL